MSMSTTFKVANHGTEATFFYGNGSLYRNGVVPEVNKPIQVQADSEEARIFLEWLIENHQRIAQLVLEDDPWFGREDDPEYYDGGRTITVTVHY